MCKFQLEVLHARNIYIVLAILDGNLVILSIERLNFYVSNFQMNSVAQVVGDMNLPSTGIFAVKPTEINDV